MTLVQQIATDIDDDDTDQSERLIDLYNNADDAGKNLLDDALVCICGWTLGSLMGRANSSGDY